MERTTVVLTGRVGSDIAMHDDQQGGTAFARFRLVVPRGRWNDEGTWVEQEGGWYTVKAWGNLAHNIYHSLRKGNPVVVVGRPSAQGWLNKENKVSTEIAINASAIGHDLARGISTFGRVVRDLDLHPAEGTGVEATEEADTEAGGLEVESPSPPASGDAPETAKVDLPAA